MNLWRRRGCWHRMSQQSGNSSPLLESVWCFWNSVNIVRQVCHISETSVLQTITEALVVTVKFVSLAVLSCLLLSSLPLSWLVSFCLVSSCLVLSRLALSCLVLSSLVLSYLPILHNLCKGNISFKLVNWQTNHRPALIITLVQMLNIWGHKAYLYMGFKCLIAIQYPKSPLHNTKWSKMQFPVCLSFSLWWCRGKKE